MLAVSPARAEPAAQPLLLEATIALPAVRGRLDHLALDAVRGRLAIAALGNDTVEVVDLAARARVASIAGCARPTGIAFLAQRRRLAVACSGDGALAFYDADSLARMGKIGGLDDADNVRVAPGESALYVGFGEGAIARLDVPRLERTATFPLPAHPESFQVDAERARIFVNVPGAHAIVSVPLAPNRAARRFATGARRGNYPLTLDANAQRLWVVFRRPPQLAAFDAESGAERAAVDVCGDADDVFLDPRRGRAYVTCGEGFVDVLDTRGARPTRLARVPTRRGARTGLYSAETDRLYVAAPEDGNAPAEVRVLGPRP